MTESVITPLADSPSGAALCVLASGSGGNCSVLAVKREGVTRLHLIDLGLSPRRTFKHLAELGFGPHDVDSALITHLDSDHLSDSWLSGVRSGLPPHVTVHLHARHAGALLEVRSGSTGTIRLGGPGGGPRVRTFDDAFDLEPGVRVRPALVAHDHLGATAMRFDFSLDANNRFALGFATDVGHVTAELVALMRCAGGVNVLAIESNYCPRMQAESDRPEQLKRRIMGGSGHLSNHQCVEAIQAIEPKDHVVLLHLSRQCNDPALVAGLHDGADYAFTITSQFERTRWIRLAPSTRGLKPGRVSPAIAATANLWTNLAESSA